MEKNLFKRKQKTSDNKVITIHNMQNNWTGLKDLAEGDEFIDKFVEEERKKKQAGCIY